MKHTKYALGGLSEHGLRVGDTIIEQINDDLIKVFNPATGVRMVNIGLGMSVSENEYSGIPHSYAEFQKELALLYYRIRQSEANLHNTGDFESFKELNRYKNDYIDKVREAWEKIIHDSESKGDLQKYEKYLQMYRKAFSNNSYSRGGVSSSRMHSRPSYSTRHKGMRNR